MTTIRVRITSTYGREVIRPANGEASVLAQLAGTKTLTRRSLELAERLGLTVVQVIVPEGFAQEVQP